jgi:hypothetical protein
MAAISAANVTPDKRDRMRSVLALYLDGQSLRDIATTTGYSKSTVSVYLNETEEMVDVPVIRRPEADPLPTVIRGTVDAERPNGIQKASIRDFHSFRVTWVTLALTAGVPMELVTRVTGHQTTDIVLKHYFQPGREDFRRALQSAMPELLTNGHSQTPSERALVIADHSTPETAWEDVQAIRQLLARR